MRAAQAARCAAEQNQFWTLRDVMGANPDKLDLDHILGFRDGPEDGRHEAPHLHFR